MLAIVAGLAALAPLGRHVLRRGVVFIDLAVAQAAAVGALLALALADHPHWAVTQISAALGALVATALVAALARLWPENREALIGLLYVCLACSALLMARQDPHGLEHLHALLAADVLWAGAADVVCLALCATGVWAVRRYLALDRPFYGTFGLVVGLAVQVLGLFLVFAALIVPGLWERAGVRPLWATCLSLGAAICGLAASWIFDAPSGPLVALALGVAGFLAVVFAKRGSFTQGETS